MPRSKAGQSGLNSAAIGRGAFLWGDLEFALSHVAKIPREAMFDQSGLMCIRRSAADGHFYFIANRGTNLIEGWTPLARAVRSALVYDPLSGRSGVGAVRSGAGGSEIQLSLPPGASVILRTFADRDIGGRAWDYWESAGEAHEITGQWRVEFIEGGPTLVQPQTVQRLGSWTEFADPAAQAFAGTARYTIHFDAPGDERRSWRVDLGKVCQSARVKLNGEELGTLITAPFQVVAGPLQERDNVLEVEVTSSAANRIRDLDRRGVKWKIFHDINFVDQGYKPFDASNWPLADGGLLGPVTIMPVRSVFPDRAAHAGVGTETSSRLAEIP